MTYRDYMDRQCVDEETHARLLALEGRKRRRPYGKAAVAAALCCVIGLGVYGLGAAGTREHPADLPDSFGIGEESIYLYRPDLSELPKLTFTKGDNGATAALDIAPPKGWFVLEPSMETFAAVLGQRELLHFEGEDVCRYYDVSAEVIYGGDGTVWIASLTGRDRETGYDVFHVELSPDGLPPACMPFNGDESCTVWGTPVRAGMYRLKGNEYGGRTVTEYVATFVREGEETVGARINVTMADAAAGEELMTRIVSQLLRPEHVLMLAPLAPAEIPEWRSEQLTEENAARAEEGFGAYLPTALPEGFRFSGAWRELGQDRDYLSMEWEWGEYFCFVTVNRLPEDPVPVEIDNPASWDLHLYNSVDKPNPPEEYWDSVACPVFRAEDVTPEVIEKRLYAYPKDKKSRAEFCVLFPDGVQVRWYGCGTVEEIWTALCSIPAFANQV